MTSFLATLVFQIEINQKKERVQFDEQFRFLVAKDETDALIKAEEMGLADQESFENEKGQRVNWRFLGTTRLINLSNVPDGGLAFSNHHEHESQNGFRLLQETLAENLLKRTIFKEFAGVSPNKK